MSAFAPLRDELALWRDSGRRLPVWWRDDDAVDAMPQLDRLIALAGAHGAPVHLAVIPEPATEALVERLAGKSLVKVMQHGWRHANHAPAGAKKAEFGAHRSVETMVAEISEGRRRIDSLFGASAVPMFVPPWNRIAPELVDALPSAGLRGVSTFGPRSASISSSGLACVNTHLDPIDWHGTRSLKPIVALIADVVAQLAERRLGRADEAEPFGLLTHHLVHDDAIWAFSEKWLALMAASGVADWTDPLPGLSDRA